MSCASPPDADATFDQGRRINWGAVARILIAALIVPEHDHGYDIRGDTPRWRSPPRPDAVRSSLRP